MNLPKNLPAEIDILSSNRSRPSCHDIRVAASGQRRQNTAFSPLVLGGFAEVLP